MKKVFINSVSLFVCILLVITSLPLSAFADGGIVAPTGLIVSKDEYGEDYLTWNEVENQSNGGYYYNVYKSTDNQNYTFCERRYGNVFYLPSDKGSFSYYVTAVYGYYDDNGNYSCIESNPSNAVPYIKYNSGSVWFYGYYSSEKSAMIFEWSDYNESSQTGYDGYKIFLKRAGTDYQCIANVPAKYSYQDEDYSYTYPISSNPDKYYFVVIGYSVINGVEYYDFDESNAQYEEIQMEEPVLTTKTKSEKIKWKKYSGFDSYEIWQYFKGKENRIAVVSGSTSSYTVKGVDNFKYDYTYYIKAIRNGECVTTSYPAYSDNGEARFRAVKKLKKKKNTVKVINTRVKKSKTAWTSSLSKKDKKTLQKFAKKHFKKGWSDMQKAQYTLEWINKNVHYAKGKDYNKIAGCTYVDAIFNKKAGQCLQYNGAYAMMLTYLGYEARIVQGWRGTPKNKWSHYWCEMKIDGKWYLMETGNYEDSGSWMYFCQTYRNAGGYMLNGKVAK